MSASSERPRDRLGRPLPVGDPRAFPTVPERDYVDAEQAWTEGINYLEQGLPFHAHEVFEQRWKCAPHDEREAWQALAQWGAALTHDERGNSVGKVRVATRAAELLQRADQAHSIPAVIDVDLVRISLSQLT